VVVNSKGKLATAPEPAAPKSDAGTLSRLRDKVKHQGAEIARLRKLVMQGG